MLLKEELERPLQPDYKRQADNKQDVSYGKKGFIEKQDHPKEQKKYPKSC